jgi:hypothetical protein
VLKRNEEEITRRAGRPIRIAQARRRIDLVFRSGFPRPAALRALAQVIRANLPNTVRVLSAPKPPAAGGGGL